MLEMVRETSHQKQSLPKNEIFAVIYRSERKKILRNQLCLIKWLRSFLSQSYSVRSLYSIIGDDAEKRIEIDDLYKKIYLSYMMNEIGDINHEDNSNEELSFKSPDKEHWYWYRRLHLREYFY